MSAVFIDASFWVTYRKKSDARQNDAARIVARLYHENARLVSTLPIFCEIHAAFTRDPQQREVVIQDLWKNHLVTIEEISMQDQANAMEILRTNDDKTYSLCDALSFAVMRRLRIGRAASFDRHFKQFGEFEILT